MAAGYPCPSDRSRICCLITGRGLRLGETRSLRLDRITSEDEALAVQDEAVAGRHSSLQGHLIAATTSLTQRLLGCPEPVTAPLLAADVLQSGASLRLPAGVIGAGCESAFMIARPFPLGGEDCTRAAVESAVATCRLGIGVLGRRVPACLPLNQSTRPAPISASVSPTSTVPAPRAGRRPTSPLFPSRPGSTGS